MDPLSLDFSLTSSKAATDIVNEVKAFQSWMLMKLPASCGECLSNGVCLSRRSIAAATSHAADVLRLGCGWQIAIHSCRRHISANGYWPISAAGVGTRQWTTSCWEPRYETQHRLVYPSSVCHWLAPNNIRYFVHSVIQATRSTQSHTHGNLNQSFDLFKSCIKNHPFALGSHAACLAKWLTAWSSSLSRGTWPVYRAARKSR